MLPQKIRERKKPGEIDLNFFLLLGFIFGSVLWLKTCKIMRFILHVLFIGNLADLSKLVGKPS